MRTIAASITLALLVGVLVSAHQASRAQIPSSRHRAGKGTSDPDPAPAFRTSRVIVEDLSRVLRAAPDITREQVARIEAAWLELQRELAGRSSQGRLVIAQKSGHYVHVEEPALVVQAIREVVQAARSRKP